jgi:hypothetical protein
MSRSSVENRTTARADLVGTGKNLASDGSMRTETSTVDDLEEVVVTGTRKSVAPGSSGTTYSVSDLQIIKFPSDVGAEGVPYVLFKIFEVETGAVAPTDLTTQSLRAGASEVSGVVSALSTAVPGGDVIVPSAIGGALGGLGGALAAGALATQAGQEAVDSAGALLFGDAATGPLSITNRAKNLVRDFALKRNIIQQKLAIGLFMPEGINTSYDNEYEALSVTATLGLGGFAAQALSAKNGAVEDINPYIAEAAATLATKILGGDASATKLGLFATTGRVVNPQLEMLYTSPVLRRFVFDFRMVPRNRKEADDIKAIIYFLKLFSAPTVPDNSTGRYFIPPAQFEIEFYDGNNNLNANLFKTKKCVLSSINIDFAPNGYATFDDGMPVETRMQLTFQETAIIDRTAVGEGY